MADYVLALSEAEIARYRSMAASAVTTEQDLFAAAGIVPGAVVADVGCGPGAVSVELARLVSPGGSVLAVDRDTEALAVADKLVAAAGVDNVTTRAGAADASGIDPGSVDVVMMRHVLAHNGGREQDIVGHLATLVRPGGFVYLHDIDGSALRLMPAALLRPVSDLQTRYFEFQVARGNDMSVGLRLSSLLSAAELEVTAFVGRYSIIDARPGMRTPAWAARAEMLAAGVIDQDDITRCEEAFAELDKLEVPLTIFVAGFTAIGRRPG
jgi:precorrin-6B methylase 2